MMHRQEETQRRRRLAAEMAVRNHHLQSLSRCSHSHIVAHTRQLPWQVHTNHTYESTNGNLSQKIFFSLPSCLSCSFPFTVLPSDFCYPDLRFFLFISFMHSFFFLIYIYFWLLHGRTYSKPVSFLVLTLQGSKFDKMANVLPSCTGVQLVSVQSCHVKGAHRGGRREEDVGLWRGKDDKRRELGERSEQRERGERRSRQLHPAPLPQPYSSPPSGHAEQRHER